MSDEKGRRQIRLETRFGSSRQSRSRKNRPCDVCRSRKSACVIAVKPPCRFCETRGHQCTFESKPHSRRRTVSSHPTIQTEAADDGVSHERPALPIDQKWNSVNESQSHLSPQASRFPVPASYGVRNIQPTYHSPVSPASSDQTNNHNSPLHVLAAASQRKLDRRNSYPLTFAQDSLEDGTDLTAHFIGLSGEQDTDMLASIRYNVLNESKFVDFNFRQVRSGDILQGSPPIHFSILNDSFPEREQQAKRIASDAIEHLVSGYENVLLRLYFHFVHPMFPVLSKARILKQWAIDRLSIPASLRGAIFGLACAFWNQDEALKEVPPISQAELFEHAHAALNRELDSPKLSTLQACLLVLHEQPEANGTTESPRIWAYSCQATACAQSLGLHQDPTSWRLPLWERRLRKKLWWATYFTDRWTSICHGNTPHISESSFDTSDLTMEDLASDEEVVGLPGYDLVNENDRRFERFDAARFIELINISKVLSNVLSDGFSLQTYRQTVQKLDVAPREAAIRRCWVQVEEAASRIPQSFTAESSTGQRSRDPNGPIQLAFFALKFLILRSLMAPATSEFKINPDSKLRHHFLAGMLEGEAFVSFMTKTSKTDLHIFWPRQSRTNLIISTNFLLYLFFRGSTEGQVAKAYEMLQRYQDLLRSMAESSDWSMIGLIRPSLLRTQSFFLGAAEGIRLAGCK